MAYLDGHLLGVETARPVEPPVCDGADEVDMTVNRSWTEVTLSVRDYWLSCAKQIDAVWSEE